MWSWCLPILSSTAPLKHAAHRNFPVAHMVKNLFAMRETWVDPWVRKILWRGNGKPTPVFLPGESPWTEEPGYSPWGRKDSDMTERLSTNTFTISSPTSKINLLKHLISLLLPGLTDSNLAALNLPTSLNTPKMQAWSCHSPTSNFSLVVWHCPQANVPVLKLSLQGSL